MHKKNYALTPIHGHKQQTEKEKKNGCSGLNHVAGKGHGRHAQLKKMIKVCIYNPNPMSGSTTLTEADGRRRNEKSAREAAGRSG